MSKADPFPNLLRAFFYECENGGAIFGHASGGIVLLRAA